MTIPTWKLSDEPLVNIGFAVSDVVTKMADSQMPDLADMFPFRKCWAIKRYFDVNWMAFRITDSVQLQVPHIDEMKSEKIAEISTKIIPSTHRMYEHLYNLLGESWYKPDSFILVLIAKNCGAMFLLSC